MAYENVEFVYPNFCLSPLAGQFGSVNIVADDILRIKNISGPFILDYTLDTPVTDILSIEYAGPRGVALAHDATLGSDLPYFTLERNSSTQCTIREWRINGAASTLDLENTLTISGAGANFYDFNCYDMAVEHYETTFALATTTGTGQIEVTSFDNVEVGDKLLLGPSTDSTNTGATEWVTVTGTDATYVYMDSSKPVYEYAGTNAITYIKGIHLFSDVGQNNDSTKGSLYKLHPYTGAVVTVDDSGLYNNVRASAWSQDYDAVGVMKNNSASLLYVDPNNNYLINRSHICTNIEDDDVTPIQVYDLVFDNTAIYRLQGKVTFRDNSGVKTTTTWGTYNYHTDAVPRYVLNISLSATPDGIILNDQQDTMITAVVRDQFGVGVSGKTVTFSKTGDTGGVGGGWFYTSNPAISDNTTVTSSSGIAYIYYNAGYYDPALPGVDSEEIDVTAETDGGSLFLGDGGAYAGEIFDGISMYMHRKFSLDLVNLTQKPTLSGTYPTEGNDLYTQIFMTQVSGMETTTYLKTLSKFQFPGGHWGPTGPPNDATEKIVQLESESGEVDMDQLGSDVSTDMPVKQDKQISNDLQVSQTFVSRHVSAGHQDNVAINQFKFVQDAIPAFWSEKNPRNTNIFIHLNPYVDDLNSSTLVFKVREVSYEEDTGYQTVIPQTITGDGSGGLNITYNPPTDFHHNAVVYVSIEIYDVATTPNIVLVDYWFIIIPDFKAPYIDNENPAREEEDVALDTNIEFDILDAGEGVDIDTLEFYVNNRRKTPTTTTVLGGYHIEYDPAEDFYYGETVEITVKVDDISDAANTLYDMWRFYVVGSTGPWIDRDSIYPRSCTEGRGSDQTDISVNILAINGTGVDRESIVVHIGGKERDVKIRPIIYRLS